MFLMGREKEHLAVNMEQKFSRHCVGKHPLFRAKLTETGVWWQDNVYYLWWEFLRLHEGYRKTCQLKGMGKYRKLYADFGDVHATDFKTWWSKDDRGLRLFAEPAAPTRVTALTDEEAIKLIEEGRDERVLLVAIPLEYRRKVITNDLRRLLKENHGRKRGDKRIKTSRAKYPLARAFDVKGLQKTLHCYKLKLDHPEFPLWEIADRVLAKTKRTAEERAHLKMNRANSDILLSLTSAGSRKMKIARNIVENVANGLFPLDEG